ncbi:MULTISPECIES: hypothetical protein [unclassified Pseudomonas]|uniref:hypothetical protein n=1 Tax=unclassified Pseudomonas TaxID=196821 RepID=UPI0006F2F460|nr:hypothetical protein [Pseudomonas sp. Leaf434]KQT67842.1 hypothetical protein ASG55_08175 [Pseudomonas sp. Leaf434]
MNDQKLLELAARAAGVKGVWQEWWDDLTDSKSCGIAPNGACGGDWWNPLEDDGKALRLAIRLGICIVFMEECDSVVAEHSAHGVMIVEAMDDYGTRRSIVRAAAEIGSRP